VCVCMRVDQGEVGVERVCLGCALERRLLKFVPLLAVRMPFVERSRRAHAHTHGHTHTHKHKHTHTHTHTHRLAEQMKSADVPGFEDAESMDASLDDDEWTEEEELTEEEEEEEVTDEMDEETELETEEEWEEEEEVTEEEEVEEMQENTRKRKAQLEPHPFSDPKEWRAWAEATAWEVRGSAALSVCIAV